MRYFEIILPVNRGSRRCYQEKMASPEKMPQVVCWTFLLIIVLQISFVSWTVVDGLEDLKVWSSWNGIVSDDSINESMNFKFWSFMVCQIWWIWGFDCIHELWSCDTVSRNYFFRPGTDLRCLDEFLRCLLVCCCFFGRVLFLLSSEKN